MHDNVDRVFNAFSVSTSDAPGAPLPAPPAAVPGSPYVRPVTNADRLSDVVQNAMSLRSTFMQQLLDPRRSVAAECGLPFGDPGDGAGNSVNVDLYKWLYTWEAIPSRVVQLLPKECWQVTPDVYENESAEPTEFEQAWDLLGRQLRGAASYYQDEQGSPVWEVLKRADVLSGIGTFGVVLLGVDDGRALDQPVDGVTSHSPDGSPLDTQDIYGGAAQPLSGAPNLLTGNARASWSMPGRERGEDRHGRPFVDAEVHVGGLVDNFAPTPRSPSVTAAFSSYAGVQGTDAQYLGVQLGPSEYPASSPSGQRRRLLFVRAFDESLVEVVQYEANVLNPRFGHPVMYRITLNDPRQMHSGVGQSLASVRVHWSRVVHLADVGMNAGSSEIFALPRMGPVLGNLLGLRKLYAGSPEMYWRGAFPGYVYSTHPTLGDVPVDQAAMKDSFEQYMNGLQRYLLAVGGSITGLAPQVVDPTAQINVQIEAICVQLGCPVRVFKGSERGELASSQDDAAWNDRLRERQNGYITPRIIVPFIDRLIAMGVLPVPRKGNSKHVRREDRTSQPQQQPPVADVNTRPKAAAPVPPPNGKAPASGNGKAASPAVGNASPGLDRTVHMRHAGRWGDFIVNAAGKVVGERSRGGYSVQWPDLDSLGDADKATVALTRMQAASAYVQGGVEALIPPDHALAEILGEDEESVAAMLDAVREAHASEPGSDGAPLTMPPSGEQGHPATPPPEPKPPVIVQQPGKGPPGSGGSFPPGEKVPPKPPGTSLGGAKGATQTAAQTANAERFHRPENYDKIHDLPDGMVMGAGANDWEVGWSAVGLHDGHPRETEPSAFTEIPHDECPGCHGHNSNDENGPGSKEGRDACEKYAKDWANRWIKERVTHNLAGPHDHASTQVQLPPALSSAVLALSREVLDEDLADGGREDEPHVTVLYGLDDPEDGAPFAEQVRQVVANFGPIRVRLGRANVFSASRAGKDCDIIKLDVVSPDLVRLNRLMRDYLPYTPTHPGYVPHVTLAYVRPGLGQAWADALNAGAAGALVGQSFVADSLVLSGRDGDRAEIWLADRTDVLGNAEQDHEAADSRWITTEAGQHLWLSGDGTLHTSPGGEQLTRGGTDGRAGDGRGGREAGGPDEGPRKAVEGAPARPADQGPAEERSPGAQPAGGAAPQGVPRDIGEVNRRLDRFEQFFQGKGQHETAKLMGMLRDHINEVGVGKALEQLGPVPERSGRGKEEVQYWGVGTEEANWKSMGHFMEAYLTRNGIKAVTGDASGPDGRLISALGKPDRTLAGDFKPASDVFKDKLDEAKHLPGLEKSEDIGKIMGKDVTHLTPEVTSKLDERYGKGQWIVKSYGDEAAAGYGIFFPQRAEKVAQDARDTLWAAGERLGKYGFNIDRDPDGKAVGLVHQSGDTYRFGSQRYNDTIRGDAREWGDRAAAAADNEKGAKLPEGSFMAQPAFKAVGISDAERAEGRTWHAQNEGRVHLVTKPDGSVEVIQHATWLKGGNLPAVFKDDHVRALEKAARETVERIPPEARRGQVYAPDVMKTADGYRVVELNAQGDHNGSGYLHDNHFTIDAYTSHLVGRAPAHAEFIHSLLSRKAGTANTFCPTGAGGGVDPSCSSGGGASEGHSVRHDILREVVAAGKESGKEHAVILDRSGNVVGRIEGGATSTESIPAAKEPGAGLTVVHNHPDDSDLSPADLKAFAKDRGVDQVVAVTHSGMVHSVRIVGDRDELYRAVSKHEADVSTKIADQIMEVDNLTPEIRAQFRQKKLDMLNTVSDRMADLGLVSVSRTGVRTHNAFCPTGIGGGVDASCSPGGNAPPPQESKGGGLLGALKAIGATVAHWEHAAKQWAEDRLDITVARLPRPVAAVVQAAFHLGRVGTQAAFATWTAGQALAERVAVERGMTTEQARKLRGVLASADIGLAKPVVLAGEVAHLASPVLLAASMVPPATAGYLAYSTARSPLATARAAKGLIGEALGRATTRTDAGARAAEGRQTRPELEGLDARNALDEEVGRDQE